MAPLIINTSNRHDEEAQASRVARIGIEERPVRRPLELRDECGECRYGVGLEPNKFMTVGFSAGAVADESPFHQTLGERARSLPKLVSKACRRVQSKRSESVVSGSEQDNMRLCRGRQLRCGM